MTAQSAMQRAIQLLAGLGAPVTTTPGIRRPTPVTRRQPRTPPIPRRPPSTTYGGV